MSQLLESLLALQQLDDRISEIERKKDEIPARIRAGETSFKTAGQKLAEEKDRLQDAARRQRALERELQEGQEKRKKQQARLLEVKTNEEYKALLKEIEHAGTINAQREDQILMLFEEIEQLEAAVQECERQLKESERSFDDTKKILDQAAVQIEEEYDRYRHERERVTEGLEKAVLSEYETLRTRRAGQAVVIVTDNVCPGCHMNIPPQTVNEVLQTGEIRRCQSCRRILYCQIDEEGGGS